MIKLSIAVKGIRLSMAMLSYNRMTVSICSDGMMKCMIKLSIAMKGLKKTFELTILTLSRENRKICVLVFTD